MVKKRNENAIVMENIQKYFNGLCVLKNFNVSIKKGSIHALLGENGAGKTTLMNILYGLYKADSGTIVINGLSIVTFFIFLQIFFGPYVVLLILLVEFFNGIKNLFSI